MIMSRVDIIQPIPSISAAAAANQNNSSIRSLVSLNVREVLFLVTALKQFVLAESFAKDDIDGRLLSHFTKEQLYALAVESSGAAGQAIATAIVLNKAGAFASSMLEFKESGVPIELLVAGEIEYQSLLIVF